MSETTEQCADEGDDRLREGLAPPDYTDPEQGEVHHVFDSDECRATDGQTPG